MNSNILKIIAIFILSVNIACDDDEPTLTVKDPSTTEKVAIDRFSALHGSLFIRDSENGLPEANLPINFDLEPFITQSFGPNGSVVRYYNFDVQSIKPAPLYVFFKPNATVSMPNQLNIIDVIPGDPGYSDFWQVFKVDVPDSYVANTVTSYEEIIEQNFPIEKLKMVVNCPVVPYGSTANENVSGNGNDLHWGWYKNKVVYYFTFEEKDLVTDDKDLVSTSPIYVTFNVNPDETNPESGPASGFVTEPGTSQTHNVIATIPSDEDYSPLWSVYVYNNVDFEKVADLETAAAADILGENLMNVNCPVVYVE